MLSNCCEVVAVAVVVVVDLLLKLLICCCCLVVVLLLFLRRVNEEVMHIATQLHVFIRHAAETWCQLTWESDSRRLRHPLEPSTTKNSSSSRAEKLALNSGTTGGARKMTQNASKRPIIAATGRSSNCLCCELGSKSWKSSGWGGGVDRNLAVYFVSLSSSPALAISGRCALWCNFSARAIATDIRSCRNMERSRRSLRRRALPVPPPCASCAAIIATTASH